MSDLFVGYNWPVQPDLWRFVKRAALGLGVGVVGLSGALAVGHRPIEGGTFEFGHVTEHQGTLVEHPVPMLRRADGNWPLLVAVGKHGAEASVRGLDGQEVTLRAKRISRNGFEMLEMADAARLKPRLHTESRPAVAAGVQPPQTPVTLPGEIVDSKCFLGVMVPGDGTTHRGCAALCLRGGIPAALHVRQADGGSVLYLITGSAATRERSVLWAGEMVQMEGTVTLQGGWQVMTTEPGNWRRLER
jgi:hypothetical protein